MPLIEGDHVNQAASPSVRASGHRLIWTGAGETLVVEPWGRDSIRVRATMRGDVLDTDWALLPPRAGSHDDVTIEIHDGGATLCNGTIRAELEPSSWFHAPGGCEAFRCALAFYDASRRRVVRRRDRRGSLCRAAGGCG